MLTLPPITLAAALPRWEYCHMLLPPAKVAAKLQDRRAEGWEVAEQWPSAQRPGYVCVELRRRVEREER